MQFALRPPADPTFRLLQGDVTDAHAFDPAAGADAPPVHLDLWDVTRLGTEAARGLSHHAVGRCVSLLLRPGSAVERKLARLFGPFLTADVSGLGWRLNLPALPPPGPGA